MKLITKIIFKNYRKFKSLIIDVEPDINILVGDNESGKSSILEAINLVLSGSKGKIEFIGLENLFNVEEINNFLQSNRQYENLPELYVELYFNEQNNHKLSGNINSMSKSCDGLQLTIKPNDDFSQDIISILKSPDHVFPFEFYKISFNTFSGEVYSGYNKYFRHILVDNSQISSEYAMQEYSRDLYNLSSTTIDKYKYQNEYRKHKNNFKENQLKHLNSYLNEYQFRLKDSSKSNLATDLTLSDGNINLDNKGAGKQCFIKTKFALNKKNDLDFILLEEPENHLSHINMHRLISEIDESDNQQLFIATHSNLIASRLNLKKLILLNSNSNKSLKLSSLQDDTANFFIKAPNNNLLQFVLSQKVILVEGAAEFILMQEFLYKTINSSAEEINVHIISINGTSFKRYLELSKLLKIRTAVIRDNDGNYEENCTKRYSTFLETDFIKVFADENNNNTTFEKCIYSNNQAICDKLFSSNHKSLNTQDFMLKNKTDAALKLLNTSSELVVPEYIKKAIEWINE
jgi:putative ATP-dependent endonuclease of the OLD family